MSSLPKQYDHATTEARLQRWWEKQGVHHFSAGATREENFVIDTPPPTVSGVLHMGHIFSYCQADFIARYQRMRGKHVFYPIGFDDNGLPTERLVEKEKNICGSTMPRADFVALCREVVQGAETQFRDLFESVALSVDWRQEYQTVSDEVRALSQRSFIALYEQNAIYRDQRPTYWDWADQTAIAQAETENKEMPGVMHTLRFGVKGGASIAIATTRPELLGACVAVMYHPEDKDAALYAGATAITPLYGVHVPMIADARVEKDMGTGLVMCCTFGDDMDKEWWRDHGLPMRQILRKDGRIAVHIGPGGDIHFQNPAVQGTTITRDNCDDLARATEAYQTLSDANLRPVEARKFVAEMLGEAVLTRAPIMHSVKCAERSGKPIEILATPQWFLRVTDKKDALLARARESQWHPEFMRLRVEQWIEGLKEDWCISRQRFFGVSFPVWYSKRAGEEGKILLARALPADPLAQLPEGYTAAEVTPDNDVMDTWATSSLSPQINARGLDEASAQDPARYHALFPADLRPQAHEIIRSWAFYTIVKSHLHAGVAPWKHIMISGWCLAADKTKMSKSKGNVVTPVALIREKGADVVRYWASTSRLGADTAFSEDLLKIGRKLVTKLWNATQFASLHLHAITPAASAAQAIEDGVIAVMLDRWVISRLHHTIAAAEAAFERFEYCDARVAIEAFFWKDFCDNYLELVKARAYGEQEGRESAHQTLYFCLDALLRLFAPFLPHIAEELYQHVIVANGEARSIHARSTWPTLGCYPSDATAEAAGSACVGVLDAIRKAKSERNVSIKFPLDSMSITAEREHEAVLAATLADLAGAGNVASIRFAATPQGETLLTTDDGRFRLAFTFGDAPLTAALASSS